MSIKAILYCPNTDQVTTVILLIYQAGYLHQQMEVWKDFVFILGKNALI